MAKGVMLAKDWKMFVGNDDFDESKFIIDEELTEKLGQDACYASWEEVELEDG